MNSLIATLVLFSSILLLFFGAPIAYLVVMSMFFPANTEPLGPTYATDPYFEMIQEPIGISINVRKVMDNGNIIWIDAD